MAVDRGFKLPDSRLEHRRVCALSEAGGIVILVAASLV